MECLKKNGVEVIKGGGEKFDGNLDEGVMGVEEGEKEDDRMEEELEKGYMVEGGVIGGSMVKVVGN